MIAPNAAFRPASLPDAVKWCPTHREAWLPSVKPGCPKCAAKAPDAPASKPAAPRVKAGAISEAKLCALLDLLGYMDINNATRATPVGTCYVREYAWGLYLSPPRLFRFDAALPAQRVAVEVDGGCHAAGRKKVKSDTERRGLAASLGWRVVALTPEQINDGRARDVIRAALGFVDRPHDAGKEADRG